MKREKKINGGTVSLGDLGRDTITGFEGVVIGDTTWLNGCRKVGLQPQGLKEGKCAEVEWFDHQQVVCIRHAEFVPVK